MTVKEVIDQLKAYEVRLVDHGDTGEEHVLLTCTEWETKTTKKEGEGSCSGMKSKGGGGH